MDALIAQRIHHPKHKGNLKTPTASLPKPQCPFCHRRLKPVGNYKYECVGGCLPVAMELWQIDNEAVNNR